MPKPDLREATSVHEPLLPIEKKLIGWSLGNRSGVARGCSLSSIISSRSTKGAPAFRLYIAR